MSEKIPIVCSLDDRQLQTRRQDFLNKAAASLLGTEDLPDGFRFRFPADDALLQNLMTLINLERKCCPFLTFRLILEAGSDIVCLELLGEKGTKEIIRELFDWN